MSSTTFHASTPFGESAVTPSEDGATRIRALVEREHEFVWRSLRRLGVAPGDVDDAVQKVFLVVSGRLSDVLPGRERAFLFSTAVRVASNERRAQRRKRSAGPEPLDALVCGGRSPENTAHDRALLDTLLDPLPIELRSVVVLFECEQLTTEEIGVVLAIPAGTVASRLRRARDLIEATMRRLRLQDGEDR